jgi:hypothetical protein
MNYTNWSLIFANYFHLYKENTRFRIASGCANQTLIFHLKNPHKWGLTAIPIRRTFAFYFKKDIVLFETIKMLK